MIIVKNQFINVVCAVFLIKTSVCRDQILQFVPNPRRVSTAQHNTTQHNTTQHIKQNKNIKQNRTRTSKQKTNKQTNKQKTK